MKIDEKLRKWESTIFRVLDLIQSREDFLQKKQKALVSQEETGSREKRERIRMSKWRWEAGRSCVCGNFS